MSLHGELIVCYRPGLIFRILQSHLGCPAAFFTAFIQGQAGHTWLCHVELGESQGQAI